MLLIIILSLFSNIVYSVSFDNNNFEAVKEANKKVIQVMINYWNEAVSKGETNSQGSFRESANKDPSINGWNWYESGVMWGAIMDYTAHTKDNTFAETVVQSVTLASFGSAGSFFGNNRLISETFKGKWNDDIGWWVMPAISGMELYGVDQQMAGGVAYSKLSKTTYDQMWEQWDNESVCPGGIYWSRNRLSSDDQMKNYKSTISNAQHLIIGMRIHKLTKEPRYLDHGKEMANWLQKQVITEYNNPQKQAKELLVHDGILVRSSLPCELSKNHQSYTAGMTAGALALYAEESGNQEYMATAEAVVELALSVFQHNGVITDLCEPIKLDEIRKTNTDADLQECQLNGISPKGTYLRGLMHFYKSTKNESLKTRIKEAVIKSVEAVKLLCDDNFVCNSDNWSKGSLSKNRNMHAQLNAIELFNALTIVSGDESNAELPPPTTAPDKPFFQWELIPLYGYILILVSLIVFIGIVICVIRMIRKQSRDGLKLREMNFKRMSELAAQASANIGFKARKAQKRPIERQQHSDMNFQYGRPYTEPSSGQYNDNRYYGGQEY